MLQHLPIQSVDVLFENNTKQTYTSIVNAYLYIPNLLNSDKFYSLISVHKILFIEIDINKVTFDIRTGSSKMLELLLSSQL